MSVAREPRTLSLQGGGASLVGRASQLRTLAEYLANVRVGRAQVVLVTGAPGIGKTRLVDEFLAGDASTTTTILRGGSSLAEGMPPYLPFLEALGDHVASTSDEVLAKQVGPHASTLAALLPDLASRVQTPSRTVSVAPEQQRFRPFEAVTAYLAAIWAERPLIVFFDDLQLADAATLELLVQRTSLNPHFARLPVCAHMVTLVMPGDARSIPTPCRTPLAPTARLEEEEHAAWRSAASQSLALWITEHVDARSSDHRERDGQCIVGYFDSRAVACAVDPVQPSPLRGRRAAVVQQRHG